VDTKIKGLDDELRKFQVQMKKANGSTLTMLKKRAMDTLKRKKMYEQQRDQLSGQLFNIDQTAFAIETVKSTQVTVAAMKEANKQLKVENKKINISDIEDMQDDLEGKYSHLSYVNTPLYDYMSEYTYCIYIIILDQLEDAGEISDILGRSYGTPNDIDEDDLEAELACLGDEFEAMDEEVPAYMQPTAQPANGASSSLSLPDLPTNSIRQPTNGAKVDEYGLPIMS
jgi:charged multivesicular body protein 5